MSKGHLFFLFFFSLAVRSRARKHAGVEDAILFPKVSSVVGLEGKGRLHRCEAVRV